MKATLFAFCFVVVTGAFAAQVATGSFVLDVDHAARQRDIPFPPACDYELLDNPGFETGVLEPWMSSAWAVDTIFPQGGTWCAYDIGNYPIEQWTDTVPGSDILSVVFWARQPDQPAAQAYSFHYSDGSNEEFVHFPTATWQQFDITYRLNTAKELVGIRFWGYSGGGPGPDSTYIDDVSIAVQGTGIAGPVRSGTRFGVVPSVGRRFALQGAMQAVVRDGCGRVAGVLRAAAGWPSADTRPGVYFAEHGGQRVRLVVVR